MPLPTIPTAAPQVGRVNQGVPAGTELGHKGISISLQLSLVGIDRGKVIGPGIPGDIGAAADIYRNAQTIIAKG